MDDVNISLPCGFETSYSSLNLESDSIKCMICNQHEIDLKKCLKMPKNQLILKEKQVENDLKILENLNEKISTYKQDPGFFIDQNFVRIFSELDTRREMVKKKIDEYFSNLLKKIQDEKNSLIIDLENKLSSIETKNYEIEKSTVDNNQKFVSKMKSLDTISNEVEIFKYNIDELETIIKKGEKYELIEPEFDPNHVFGSVKCDQSLPKYKPKHIINAHENYINSLAIFNGKILSASSDGTIKLFESENSTRIFNDHTKSVHCIIRINDFFLASGSADTTIKIWNLETMECEKTLVGHEDAVLCLRLLRNGLLISGSSDCTVKAWNIESGNCVSTFKTEHLDQVKCLEEGKNNTIISGSFDHSIKLWNIENNSSLLTLDGHLDLVLTLKVINSTFLASGSSDKTIKIWNYEEGLCSKTLLGHLGSIRCLEVTTNRHLISGSSDKSIKIWDIDSSECLNTIDKAHVESIECLLITENDELVSGSKDKKIKVWIKY